MLDDLKKEKNLFRILTILLIIAVGSYIYGIFAQVLGIFSDVIFMLLLGWLISFMLEPLVDKICSLTKLSKIWSTTIVFILFTILISATVFLFIPEVTGQINALNKILPGYFHTYSYIVNQISMVISKSLNNIMNFLPSIAQFFLVVFLAIIFSFYFIIDKDKINKEFFSFTPKSWHEHIKFFQKVINDVFGSFLRVQLIFGIIGGIFTWLVLRGVNSDFAASTALLAGLLTTIPLIGPILAIIPAVFVALLISPTAAIVTFIAILAFQQVLFNVVGPKLLGRAFKTHPAIVIISFFLGFKIAGLIGAILAVPVLGILTVVVRDLSHHFLIHETKD